MSFPLWCLIVGGAMSLASYLLKDLFVDDADAHNPFRSLVSATGYLGVIAVVYGAVLLVYGASTSA